MLGQKKSHTASSHTRTLRKACRQTSLTWLGRKERHTRALRKTWNHIFVAIVGVLMLTNPAHAMDRKAADALILKTSKLNIKVQQLMQKKGRMPAIEYDEQQAKLMEEYHSIRREQAELSGKTPRATLRNPPSDQNGGDEKEISQPTVTPISRSATTTRRLNELESLPGGYRTGDVVYSCEDIAMVKKNTRGVVELAKDGKLRVLFKGRKNVREVFPHVVTLPGGYRPGDVVELCEKIVDTDGNVAEKGAKCKVRGSNSGPFGTHEEGIIVHFGKTIFHVLTDTVTLVGGYRPGHVVFVNLAICFDDDEWKKIQKYADDKIPGVVVGGRADSLSVRFLDNEKIWHINSWNNDDLRKVHFVGNYRPGDEVYSLTAIYYNPHAVVEKGDRGHVVGADAEFLLVCFSGTIIHRVLPDYKITRDPNDSRLRST